MGTDDAIYSDKIVVVDVEFFFFLLFLRLLIRFFLLGVGNGFFVVTH